MGSPTLNKSNMKTNKMNKEEFLNAIKNIVEEAVDKKISDIMESKIQEKHRSDYSRGNNDSTKHRYMGTKTNNTINESIYTKFKRNRRNRPSKSIMTSFTIGGR